MGSAFFEPQKHSYLLNLISSLGTALGGTAGVVTAVAAILGVNTWKKQLKSGKHIVLIWNCMESLRNFERRHMQWYILARAKCVGGNIPEESVQVEKELLDRCLEELGSSFNTLDRIVVKNDWQWANYGRLLQLTISEFVSRFREYSDSQDSVHNLDKELLDLNKRLKSDTKFLENELENLESKYQ